VCAGARICCFILLFDKTCKIVVTGIKVHCRLMHILGSYGANFSPYRHTFSPEVIHMGFMGDRVVLVESFSRGT
jgi:hypothetical protein